MFDWHVGRLAPLWPLLGIVAEVLVLCVIIFFYERNRAQQKMEEERREGAEHRSVSAGTPVSECREEERQEGVEHRSGEGHDLGGVRPFMGVLDD